MVGIDYVTSMGGADSRPTSGTCSGQHIQQLALVLHQNEEVVAKVRWEVATDHPEERGGVGGGGGGGECYITQPWPAAVKHPLTQG